MDPLTHHRRLVSRLMLLLVTGSLAGCSSNPSGPFDDDDEPMTESELDREEYREFGCLGAYEYDWENNCRKPSQKLCHYENVAGCQTFAEKDAYDADGTCWHFNRCIPNGDFWPAEPGDVCHHDRAAVPLCGEEQSFLCDRLDETECEADDRCRAEVAFRYDEEYACLETGSPIFADCVPADQGESEPELVRLDGSCYWTGTDETSDCDAVDAGLTCEFCPVIDGEPDSCLPRTADLGAVRWDQTGTPDPLELDDAEGESPDPCVPASLGAPKFRVAGELVDAPPLNQGTVQILIPIHNDVSGLVCGFAGQQIRMQMTGTLEPTDVVAFWPEDEPCNEDTYLSATMEMPRFEQEFQWTVTVRDSCGSGGGTINFPFWLEGLDRDGR